MNFDLRLAIAIGRVLIAMVCATVPCKTAFGQDIPGSAMIFDNALTKTSSRLGVVFDPEFVSQIQMSVGRFVANFCYPQWEASAKSAAEQTILSEPVMEAEVLAFVSEAMAGSATIRGMGERLAKRLNKSMTMAGWSSEEVNEVAVVKIPQGHVIDISQRSLSGKKILGKATNAILLMPGHKELLVTGLNGMSGQVILDLTPRQRAPLPLLSPVSATKFFGAVAPAASDFCYRKTFPNMQGDKRLSWFNWGRARFQEPAATTQLNINTIARRAGVNIQLRDLSGACVGDCVQSVGATFAKALSAWRAGCERCDGNAMSILRFADTIWIDGRIESRLSMKSGASLDLSKHLVDEAAVYGVPPSLAVAQSRIYTYRPVIPGSRLFNDICLIAPNSAPWVPAARELICKSQSRADITDALLVIVPRQTSCGPSADFLACGMPGKRIELTTDAVQYSIPTPDGRSSFGTDSSQLKVDLEQIVYHETGHWFGVPHFTESSVHPGELDVMAAQIGDGETCIAAMSLQMLNNAMDMRWPYAIKGNSGLRRPHGVQ